MKKQETLHLVKMEDLNHHGTLFAAKAGDILRKQKIIAIISEVFLLEKSIIFQTFSSCIGTFHSDEYKVYITGKCRTTLV